MKKSTIPLKVPMKTHIIIAKIQLQNKISNKFCKAKNNEIIIIVLKKFSIPLCWPICVFELNKCQNQTIV